MDDSYTTPKSFRIKLLFQEGEGERRQCLIIRTKSDNNRDGGREVEVHNTDQGSEEVEGKKT